MAHVAHCGIPKLNTAADDVQLLVTVAELHGDRVVVVQAVIVAAAQSAQSFPSAQSLPSSHFAHCGIVKSNTAAELVQELTTLAELQAAQVVVLPTVIVAAVQSVQSFPSLPSAHGAQGVQGSHFRFLY